MIAAVMATQFILSLMISHGYIALYASGRLTASGTLYLRCIAASVLEQDHLFVIRQALAYAVH